MRDIKFYIDKAMQKHGIKSGRQLGVALNKSANAITQFTTGRAWPSDDTMIKLAKLAGEDEKEALIYLNAWRTKGETQKSYLSLLKMVALSLTFAVFVSLAPSSADAKGANMPHDISGNIYYGKLKRILRRGWLFVKALLYPKYITC
jgi:hypothetical protein